MSDSSDEDCIVFIAPQMEKDGTCPDDSDEEVEEASPEADSIDLDFLDSSDNEEVEPIQVSNVTITQPKVKRCALCKQEENSALMFDEAKFNSDHDEVLRETDAVVHPSLSFVNDEQSLQDFKLDEFYIYDENRHLVPLDAGLIEQKRKLFFSGTVRSCFDDTKSLAVLDAGPIKQWWLTGYLEGEELMIGVSTANGQYWLQRSGVTYGAIYQILLEKKNSTKMVYTILSDIMKKGGLDNYHYEDLLEDCIKQADTYEIPEFSEQVLLSCGRFVIAQIVDFEQEADEDELTVLDSVALHKLSRLSNAGHKKANSASNERGKRLEARKSKKAKFDDDDTFSLYEASDSEDDDFGPRRRKKIFKRSAGFSEPSKATTTPLVAHFFESVFGSQMSSANSRKKRGCGACESCKLPDCGSCEQCLKMIKFNGHLSNDRVSCDLRQCKKGDIFFEPAAKVDQKTFAKDKTRIAFDSDSIGQSNGSTYYDCVHIGKELLNLGDYVQILPIDSESSPYIGKIITLFESKEGKKVGHIRWFAHGQDTILADTADPKELFAVKECEDVLLDQIMCRLSIEHCPLPNNWSMLGGTKESIVTPSTHIGNQDNIYWYRHLYDPELAKFTRVPQNLIEESEDGIECNTCTEFKAALATEVASYDSNNGILHQNNQRFTIGDGVMLLPGSFRINLRQKKGFRKARKVEPKDAKRFPEHWRKEGCSVRSFKGNTENLSDPFDIGIIVKIVETNQGIELRVRCLYRPENTQFSKEEAAKMDVNLLFWTEEIHAIQASNVEGKCFILPIAKIAEDHPFLWASKGNFRFYYEHSYDTVNHKKLPLPKEAAEYSPPDPIEDFLLPEQPMAMMDVFAGCGGLSIGLEQSGVAKAKWAIEIDEAAAEAFKQNHDKDCHVIVEDVNSVLAEVMNDTHKGRYPKKGEVDLLCGGPPCQGFSIMNVFTANDASMFKNSLISSFLSVCDFYRPKYFILENVKNFAAFKNGQILRLCIRALVLMGYQCQFGVLQAGNFGVPQNRKRTFLLASAPSVPLPNFPAARHVFEKMPLTVIMDEKSFDLNSIHWRHFSAPYRFVNVRDAIADLPSTSNKGVELEKPSSYFQKLVRWNDRRNELSNEVKDHVSRTMSAIVMARLKMVPKHFGSDWRDLPNDIVRLPDGTSTEKLRYHWVDYRTGKPAVCHCATSKNAACSEEDKQSNTLIPWALAHTANSHNHWSGLYGRVAWDSYFSTTVTNVHPDGKQGRVLHPDQDRLLSVREMARSQGFPDRCQFYGSVIDKYRQIGNAVPPPLGRALGMSIICSQIEEAEVMY